MGVRSAGARVGRDPRRDRRRGHLERVQSVRTRWTDRSCRVLVVVYLSRRRRRRHVSRVAASPSRSATSVVASPTGGTRALRGAYVRIIVLLLSRALSPPTAVSTPPRSRTTRARPSRRRRRATVRVRVRVIK